MKFRIKNKYARYITWMVILTIVVMVFGMGFVAAVRLGFFGPLPSFGQLEKIEHNNASRIMSADGKLLGLYYYQNRTDTKIEDVPQSLIDGLVATEDARFYSHNGFDTRSFFRVIFKTILLSDRSAGGGSTISQQLAKNLFPRKDFGLISMPVVKVKEIITAIRLEKIYSKKQILELYLNTVSFGENTYGIETAALTYFNKKPKDLSIPESAVLVGLLKANTGYNPRLNRKAATVRRNTVIGQMVKYGYLSDTIADSLKQLPVVLHFNKMDHVEGPAPYFREYLRRQAEEILNEMNEKYGTDYNLYADGLVLHTTLRADLQAYAEDAVMDQMADLQKTFDLQWHGRESWKKNSSLARMQIEQSVPYQKLKRRGLTESQILDTLKIPHKTKIFTWKGEVDTIMSSLDSILYHFSILQCGMLAMDAHNGHILAWVGGPDYKYFKYDHVLSARQVGSTIKPFIYASAIENGVEPCDYYENDSIAYKDYDNWVPKNADHRYGGYYSVQGALVNSVNTVSVQLLMETGIPETIINLQKAGIKANLPEVPSLALGTAEIPLYQMVQAYSVFLNRGSRVEPVFLESIFDNNGKVIYETPATEAVEPVFSVNTVETMQVLLKGVVNRGTASGLRNNYKLTNEMGGKTGTTQDQTDGWFMGLTPEMIVGVWVGGDNPVVRFRNLTTGQGARTAMPVFAKFIQNTIENKSTRNFASGSFGFPDKIYRDLACADFKETRGIFDFLKKKPEYGDRKDQLKRDRTGTSQKDDQTKVGKFLRNIFGKDDKKKKKRK
ncbi:MAG: transglycosylase domain-containing protein [Bacteroidetes bacterium]|nr:transglycosylase domain-containing protein [Bacteroidota bacterium]